MSPENYLQYRVLPDSQAEQVEQERQGLRGLREVLDWRSFNSDPGEDATSMSKVVDALKRSVAVETILCWIELRSIETVVQAKQALLTLQEQLRSLNMEVELREPFEAELNEMREFVKRAPE